MEETTMATTTEIGVTTQVYQVYVKATPEAVWDAITRSEWTRRYGYRGGVEYDLRPGGVYRSLATEEMKEYGAPDVVVEGEVIEADPPRRLVQTWRMLFDAQLSSEALTPLTWEIEVAEAGVTKLTLTHDLEGAPNMATLVSGSVPNMGGGWPYVLSDLKTLLETGKPLAG
jgi:uncharacterized protein YndB with AHSA1/START domain